jgi:hypothetical protein
VFRPLSSCIKTIPLSVSVDISEFVEMLAIIVSTFEIVDTDDPQDKQE